MTLWGKAMIEILGFYFQVIRHNFNDVLVEARKTRVDCAACGEIVKFVGKLKLDLVHGHPFRQSSSPKPTLSQFRGKVTLNMHPQRQQV